MQKQIEQEADVITARMNDRNDYEAGKVKGFEEGYIKAGERYAEKAQAAETRADRHEKALREFADRLNDVCGQQGIISAGIHFIIEDMMTLTPKPTTDERRL